MVDQPPILVLGGGITGLGVIRILGRDGLQAFVAEPSDPLVRRSRWCRCVPGNKDGIGNRRLEDWLPGLPFSRAVLMPCSDHWASKVAALDPSLRQRFPASVPAPTTLERFVDKGRFSELLREAGAPHPWSQIVERESDLDTIPSENFSHAILKPRDSQRFVRYYRVKALHVTSRDHAVFQLKSLVAAGFPVILQEFIPGPATQHYLVDGFVDRLGVLRTVFARQRLRMYPLDFGNSTLMVSVPVEAASAAIASITSVLQRAGYRGMFSAEFKLDPRDGVFKLLELNARAWWYIDFAARCGVDVCRMAYEDALERPVATVAHYAIGRRLVFPFDDYSAFRALRRRGELSLWGWIRSWVGAMQPVFQLTDPVPALWAVATRLAGFLGRRLQRLIPVAVIVASSVV